MNMLEALQFVQQFNETRKDDQGIMIARPLSWRGQNRGIFWDKGNEYRSKGFVAFPGVSQNLPYLPVELFDEWEFADASYVLTGE